MKLQSKEVVWFFPLLRSWKKATGVGSFSKFEALISTSVPTELPMPQCGSHHGFYLGYSWNIAPKISQPLGIVTEQPHDLREITPNNVTLRREGCHAQSPLNRKSENITGLLKSCLALHDGILELKAWTKTDILRTRIWGKWLNLMCKHADQQESIFQSLRRKVKTIWGGGGASCSCSSSCCCWWWWFHLCLLATMFSFHNAAPSYIKMTCPIKTCLQIGDFHGFPIARFDSWRIPTMWGPPVISWFINPINYSYRYHKP